MAHLVFQTAFIGDLLLASALLKRLRAWQPGAAIALVCRKGCGEIFLRLGLADAVFEVDKNVGRAAWRELRRRLLEFAAQHGGAFETIFCPHESPRSAWFVRRLPARRRLGFKKWWNFWAFDTCVERPMYLPEALRQLALLAAVDATTAAEFTTHELLSSSSPQANRPERSSITTWPAPVPAFASLHAPPSAEDVAATLAKFHLADSDLHLVFIAPGSVWATKKWTFEGFLTVARHFLERGATVCFTGSNAEKELCERLTVACKELAALSAHPRAVLNLAGQTSLVELHQLFTRAKVVISNDSSPIHLAAMADAPCVAIFGPTTLQLGFRPWSDRSAVAQLDLECRPCGLHGHRQCPLGHHHCMKKLEAKEVIHLAERFYF